MNSLIVLNNKLTERSKYINQAISYLEPFLREVGHGLMIVLIQSIIVLLKIICDMLGKT
jgi:hypothetical protein